MIDNEYADNNHAPPPPPPPPPHECIKVIEAWGKQGNWDYLDGFYLGTVLRYISRNGNKKGNSKEQVLQKCINYLKMYVEKLKGDN